MELRELAGLFKNQDTSIIAVSQEDDDLAKAQAMHAKVGEAPRFELAFDLERAQTTAWDRTTAYLIDSEGVVQQIFPMIIHSRPSAVILLREVIELNADFKARGDAEPAEGDSEARGDH